MNKTLFKNQSRRDDGVLIALLMVLLTVAFLLSGCDRSLAGKNIADAPYAVVDTGYWPAQVNILAEPGWIDHERIIFTSTNNLKPGGHPYSVKVLNITTGEIVSTSLKSFICVRNGQVFYGVRDNETDQVTYYRGPLGRAEERPSPDGRDVPLKDRTVVIDRRFDCDWVPRKLPPGYGKLRGKNYLEIIEKRTKLYEYQKRPVDRKRERETGEYLGSEGKVLYHSDESDPGRLMPSGHVAYSEYLDAYVVGHNYYDPKYPETRSFWILQRNGDLEEIPYPPSMLKGRGTVYAIRSGYLVHYSDGPITETDHGDRGLYLMQGQQVQRVLIGTFGHASVSPDGCKVVVSHAKSIKEDLSTEKPHLTVKYINFCKGEMQS